MLISIAPSKQLTKQSCFRSCNTEDEINAFWLVHGEILFRYLRKRFLAFIGSQTMAVAPMSGFSYIKTYTIYMRKIWHPANLKADGRISGRMKNQINNRVDAVPHLPWSQRFSRSRGRRRRERAVRSLSINALRACVYIYIRQLSSFRAPTLWFIDLTVATCHIRYTFLSLCKFFSRENGQNTRILEVGHFCMARKWPSTVTRRAKH